MKAEIYFSIICIINFFSMIIYYFDNKRLKEENEKLKKQISESKNESHS